MGQPVPWAEADYRVRIFCSLDLVRADLDVLSLFCILAFLFVSLEVRSYSKILQIVDLSSTIAFIPLWILPTSFSALSAGAFCIQFGVQGAWGVVRVYFCFIFSR